MNKPGIYKTLIAVLTLLTTLLGLATTYLTFQTVRISDQRDEAEAEASSLSEQVSTLSEELTALEDERDAFFGQIADLGLQFDEPEGTIPHCNDFSGTGVIPEGWTLVLFDRSLVSANASYWYNKPAEPTQDGWVARRVQIGDGEGDTGSHVEISAVLLPEDFAAYLASIGSEGFWWAARLPTAAAVTMVVERNDDSLPCS